MNSCFIAEIGCLFQVFFRVLLGTYMAVIYTWLYRRGYDFIRIWKRRI